MTTPTEGKAVSAPPESDLVGVPYITRRLKCAEVTVYRWLKAGKTPAPARVKPIRWHRDTVDEWMDDGFPNVDWGSMGTEKLTEKQCTKCGEVKPISEFYRRTASKDGYQPYCKSCLKRNRRKHVGNERERERLKRAEERRELAWYREHYPQVGRPWEV